MTVLIMDFLIWLREEGYYPISSAYDMYGLLDKYEEEIETSSEKEVNVL